ncbi:MAG: CotH kinase family protein [Verrucomicrobiota bacterium]
MSDAPPNATPPPPPLPPPLPPWERPVPPPLPTIRRRRSPWSVAFTALLWTFLAVLVGYNVVTEGRWFRPEDHPLAQQGRWRGGDGRGPRRSPRMDARALQPTSLPTNLARIRIEMSGEAEDALRSQPHRFRGFGMGLDPDRPEVRATVRCGDEVFTNVALHLKGAAGSFRPYDDKPAFTLNFGKHAKGQVFRGMPKVSLNNSVQDPTFVSETLCRDLYRQAGVPVPRTDHVTVEVNGRDLGLYVLAEGWGKAFVRQHFEDDDGNLYDGGFVQDVLERPLEVVSGKHKDQHPGLGRLGKALEESNPGRRWAALTNTLDVERFISLVAVDVFVCNWDGYAINRNNYRIYDDPKTGRLVFMPHGLDQTFGVGQRMPTSASIRMPMRAQVAAAVLEHPEGRRRYLARIGHLATNVFHEEALLRQARDIAARLQPTLAAYSKSSAEEHAQWVEEYCRLIQARVQSVTQQVSWVVARPKLVAKGDSAILRDWTPQARRGRNGRPQCERVATEDGNALSIRMTGGFGAAAWRSSLLLDPGRYRVTGRLKVRGADPSAHLGFRAAGHEMPEIVAATQGWTPLSVEFAIGEPETEVDVVVEFAAWRGEALLDADGFVITRLEENEDKDKP